MRSNQLSSSLLMNYDYSKMQDRSLKPNESIFTNIFKEQRYRKEILDFDREFILPLDDNLNVLRRKLTDKGAPLVEALYYYLAQIKADLNDQVKFHNSAKEMKKTAAFKHLVASTRLVENLILAYESEAPIHEMVTACNTFVNCLDLHSDHRSTNFKPAILELLRCSRDFIGVTLLALIPFTVIGTLLSGGALTGPVFALGAAVTWGYKYASDHHTERVKHEGLHGVMWSHLFYQKDSFEKHAENIETIAQRLISQDENSEAKRMRQK